MIIKTYPELNTYSEVLNLEGEVWRDISTHLSLYQVSNFGRVKRLTQIRVMKNQLTSLEQTFEEKILKANPESKGYPQVTLTKPTRVARVHRLVAEAFLKPPSEILLLECKKAGYDVALVNHKDENINNSCSINLEWCTPSYNNDYSSYKKNQPKGSETYQAILNEEKVREIFDLLSEKVYSQDEIADMYGVKQITISNIKTGRSWNQVTGLPVKARSTKSKKVSIPISEQKLSH